jgi:para-aminobenzoate synthetase/4-amino-4-deoxychorismate lyase
MMRPAVASSSPPSPPFVLVQDGTRLLGFDAPSTTLETRDPGAVPGLLEEADRRLAGGSWVAGFVSYEAARGFGLVTRLPDPDGPPVAWLGVFDGPREAEWPRAPLGPPPAVRWQPALDPESYADAVERIRARIVAGDTAQANFTFPLVAALAEDPFALFARLVAGQRPRHASYVDLGRFVVASASPELFFRVENGVATARPMRGTAPRGRSGDEDARRAGALRSSEKERAANRTIVDVLRDDLSRVAETGSVEVVDLFDVETYPNLLQMTSTLRARVGRASLSSLVAALFPCASVTGAPRVRTMEILAAREVAPRGVYTGSIGWASPHGDASWSVAIRTAVADRERSAVVYGVGSGVVADSEPAAEYAECLGKARVLEEPVFALLETLAFLPGDGFHHLEGHLARMAASARHFSFPFDGRRVQQALREAAAPGTGAMRVRLLLHTDGRVAVETDPLAPPPSGRLRVGLAARSVDPESVWLYHKTTRREVYDEALASRPDCDDVLLWNARGEVTESAVASVIVEVAGTRLTPPLSCGLLPGVERARVLAEGRAREAVVRLADLREGSRLWLASSLRGVREGVFVG